MPYIYNTGTASTEFAVYKPAAPTDNIDVIETTILVKGGANLANKYFETPKGVMTEVSDSDLEILEKNYHFKEMVKNGFITVEKKKFEIEQIVKDMTEKDGSAPKTPEDPEFKEGGMEYQAKVATDSQRKEDNKKSTGGKKSGENKKPNR